MNEAFGMVPKSRIANFELCATTATAPDANA
jgi:hypothetical protein